MRALLVVVLVLGLAGPVMAQSGVPTVTAVHRSTYYAGSRPSCQFHLQLSNPQDAAEGPCTVMVRLVPFYQKHKVAFEGTYDLAALAAHQTHVIDTQKFVLPHKGRYLLEILASTANGPRPLAERSFTF